MKKLLPLLLCFGVLLGLGLLIVRVTDAEAPHGAVPSTAQSVQDHFAGPDRSIGAMSSLKAPSGPSATPISCATNYTYTVTSDAIVTATNQILTGCQACITYVQLPFPFTFYGQTYNSAGVESQGNMQFTTADISAPSCPFPIQRLGPALLPYWSNFVIYWGGIPPDPCVMNYGMPCGVYTSVTGSAPDRVFNVQWLGRLEGSNHETVNFEARLHESTGIIDFAYGLGIQFGSNGSVGMQDGAGHFTSYACNSSAQIQFIDIHWTHLPGPCPSSTPSFTPTSTRTSTPAQTVSPTSTHTPTALTTPSTTSIPSTATAISPTASVTPTACSSSFSDVPVGSTFYPYVTCLTCRGIVSGYSDSTFRPGSNVTRGQLSKIVSNAAGFSDPQPYWIFEDVPLGSTFQLYIGRLASRGYVSGYACGGVGEPCGPGNLPYFRPNANATRGQITKIDSEAAGYIDPPVGQQFEDVPPGSTFYTYAYRLASRSIVQGYACGGVVEPCGPGNLPYLRPNKNATRGQSSKIAADTFFPECRPTGSDAYSGYLTSSNTAMVSGSAYWRRSG